jgi:hypothetical protein
LVPRLRPCSACLAGVARAARLELVPVRSPPGPSLPHGVLAGIGWARSCRGERRPSRIPRGCRGECHATSPSNALALVGRCRRAAGRRQRASLPEPPGAHHHRLRRRRRVRYYRASDRATAVGPARPTVHRREPTWRGHQSRDGSGRPRAPRRLYASPGRRGQRRQRNALRKAQIRFREGHRTGRRHHSISFRPIPFRSSSPMPRPTPERSRLHRPAPGARSTSRANCSR